MKKIDMGTFRIGGNEPLVLIAGPCVIEDASRTREIAFALKEITTRLNMPFIFKASYDKANRTSFRSFRGPGLDKGLEILIGIKEDLKIPIISDVHRFEEIERAAAVLDVVQIPAFLCRQTDFVMEVARASRVVNIKKGQFLAPWDVVHIIDKVKHTGNENIMITERGTTFGYNNLVADMRSLRIIRKFGYPVIFDVTHSVQLPGGAGDCSGGERDMVPVLGRAGVAAGVDGIFMEVHPEPDKAFCDGANSVRLDELESLLSVILEIDAVVREKVGRDG
ncbi:MAG: 3-deoxy-8-phosphooctulonate synthase [Syntrophales bacterium]|nr:3-deoxy-8-phosphooctulonate synthase [Syntrophales bacterium]